MVMLLPGLWPTNGRHMTSGRMKRMNINLNKNNNQLKAKTAFVRKPIVCVRALILSANAVLSAHKSCLRILL